MPVSPARGGAVRAPGLVPARRHRPARVPPRRAPADDAQGPPDRPVRSAAASLKAAPRRRRRFLRGPRARQHAVDQVRGGVRHAARRARATDASSLATEYDHELVAARLAAHAREAMGEDAALEIRGQLTLDIAREPAALAGGLAQLGEHRLRVPRDELVEHPALGRPAAIAGERSSGRAGRPFVEATREHACPQWKFRAAIPERSITIFRFAVSAPRTTATPSAIDRGDKRPRARLAASETVRVRDPRFDVPHGRSRVRTRRHATR